MHFALVNATLTVCWRHEFIAHPLHRIISNKKKWKITFRVQLTRLCHGVSSIGFALHFNAFKCPSLFQTVEMFFNLLNNLMLISYSLVLYPCFLVVMFIHMSINHIVISKFFFFFFTYQCDRNTFMLVVRLVVVSSTQKRILNSKRNEENNFFPQWKHQFD